MKGLKRTHRCTEISTANIGETVTLMGWVQKSRNKGGIIFVDLRDRSGIVQLIFENGSIDAKGFEKATKLRSEFVIAVTGVVEARSGAVNNNLKPVRSKFVQTDCVFLQRQRHRRSRSKRTARQKKICV